MSRPSQTKSETSCKIPKIEDNYLLLNGCVRIEENNFDLFKIEVFAKMLGGWENLLVRPDK